MALMSTTLTDWLMKIVNVSGMFGSDGMDGMDGLDLAGAAKKDEPTTPADAKDEGSALTGASLRSSIDPRLSRACRHRRADARLHGHFSSLLNHLSQNNTTLPAYISPLAPAQAFRADAHARLDRTD